MYTGHIREVGVTRNVTPRTFDVLAPGIARELQAGGSLSVSGVSLTAVDVDGEGLRVELSDETRRRTTLDELASRRRVNLELPLRVGDRLDGHLVQGSVEAVGKVVGVSEERIGMRVWVRPPRRFLEVVPAKSRIAVDGVSLTVAEVVRDRFSVVILPATRTATTLDEIAEGSRVNLEGDFAWRAARHAEDRASAAILDAVAALPWAGLLSGEVAVEKAVAQIKAGGAVIVWDPTREGEGDVVLAGAAITAQAFAFVLTEACGYPTVPCSKAILDRLGIDPMPGAGDRQGTAFHVPVDLATPDGTGVSAAERAATVRRLAAIEAQAADFVSPGHVIPLGAHPAGLSARAGHTEAAVALCRAAGLPQVAVISEIMRRDGVMAKEADLERLALRWGLPVIGIALLERGL